jgi:DNA modification methylase
VARSIVRFGFVAPVVYWASGGRMVAGHTRIKALECILSRGYTGMDGARVAARPDFVPPGAPGAGLVPVRFQEFATEAEADAYALADNKLAEISGWEEKGLAEVQRKIATADADLLRIAGWSENELAKLRDALAENGDGAAEGDVQDPTEELRKKWQTDEGQLWLIPSRSTPGRVHRIMCGDSMNAQHIEKLRGADRWLLMVTDPPYGVEYDPTWRDDINRGSTKLTGAVLNDDVADWEPVWRMWAPQVAYVWHASIHSGVVARSLDNADLRRRSHIIWRKQHFQLSRGDYHWQHEPCWYAVQKGATSGWCGDRTQSTIWDITNLNPRGGGGKGDDAPVGHGTQKPIECMARPIRNHFQPGIIVCDPFHGSGTTLIAAERERRLCYAMELASNYVAAQLERCVKIGLEPRLA